MEMTNPLALRLTLKPTQALFSLSPVLIEILHMIKMFHNVKFKIEFTIQLRLYQSAGQEGVYPLTSKQEQPLFQSHRIYVVIAIRSLFL
jgi:hypothetical protein